MCSLYTAFAPKCQALSMHTYVYAHNTNRTEIFFSSTCTRLCLVRESCACVCCMRVCVCACGLPIPFRYTCSENINLFVHLVLFFRSLSHKSTIFDVRIIALRLQQIQRTHLTRITNGQMFCTTANHRKKWYKLKNRTEEPNTKTKNNTSLTKNERVRLGCIRLLRHSMGP